jgi:hypothetical protein
MGSPAIFNNLQATFLSLCHKCDTNDVKLAEIEILDAYPVLILFDLSEVRVVVSLLSEAPLQARLCANLLRVQPLCGDQECCRVSLF